MGKQQMTLMIRKKAPVSRAVHASVIATVRRAMVLSPQLGPVCTPATPHDLALEPNPLALKNAGDVASSHQSASPSSRLFVSALQLMSGPAVDASVLATSRGMAYLAGVEGKAEQTSPRSPPPSAEIAAAVALAGPLCMAAGPASGPSLQTATPIWSPSSEEESDEASPDDGEGLASLLLAFRNGPSPPGARPPRPVPRRGAAHATASTLQKRRGVADKATQFTCKHPGCGKVFGCPDAVRTPRPPFLLP